MLTVCIGEAKIHYVDEGGCKGFRLQARRRDGKWEATVWPGKQELGWPEGKVARGRTLEECLGELQVAIRERSGRRGAAGWREIVWGLWIGGGLRTVD